MAVRTTLLFLLACAAPWGVSADTHQKELLQRELRDTVARVLASPPFAGQASDSIALTVTLPAGRYLELGLLVDPRAPAADGLRVLGTSPGGVAQQLGLVAGDVIVRAGDRPLVGLGTADDGTARAIDVFRSTVLGVADGAPLALDVRRDGREVRIGGVVQARSLPAMRLVLGPDGASGDAAPGAESPTSDAAAETASAGACGRISTFQPPPRSQSLYPARILSIDGRPASPGAAAARVLGTDGRLPASAAQETFRLDPGPHRITVLEAIDTQELLTALPRRRPELRQRELTVVVEPGRTHFVAAHFTGARGARDYWEPVVWRTLDAACR